ncbi:hypothetical protein GIB67_033317, partial [Kingdonia uniflora]
MKYNLKKIMSRPLCQTIFETFRKLSFFCRNDLYVNEIMLTKNQVLIQSISVFFEYCCYPRIP